MEAKILLSLYPEGLERSSINFRLSIQFLWLRGPPLHWADSYRDRDAVAVLLENGADIQTERYGYSSLAKAVEIHAYDIVELLLEKGAKTVLSTTPSRSATNSIAGNAPIIRRRIVHGHRSGTKAAMQTFRKLQAYGCDIDSRDTFGNTPLHQAIASPLERQDLYLLQSLLKSGAARDVQNDHKDTPVHIAIKLHWFNYEPVKTLFEILMDDDLCFLDEHVDPGLEDGRWTESVSCSSAGRRWFDGHWRATTIEGGIARKG
ncbi:hypothetical protein MMC18_001352 [Xylographa bjoerkii]|nr:hypothetical protein [Xylographa bjoerkii]